MPTQSSCNISRLEALELAAIGRSPMAAGGGVAHLGGKIYLEPLHLLRERLGDATGRGRSSVRTVPVQAMLAAA